LILQNSNVLENESYIETMMMRMVINQLNTKAQFGLDVEKSKRINSLIVKEYINEYHGITAA
jgi:type I restriction enzyme R subunit